MLYTLNEGQYAPALMADVIAEAGLIYTQALSRGESIQSPKHAADLIECRWFAS